MRLVALCFATILFLSACSGEHASTENGSTDRSAIDEAKTAILSSLRDPDSARFSFVEINSMGIVCGSVNSKNGFGGYVGFAGFWYDPRTREAFLYDPTQSSADKAYDALLFDRRGCSIGSEHEGWLRTAKMINESNRKAGLAPIGPDQ